MQILKIEPRVKTAPQDVHAVVRSNKKYGFLFLSNFNDEPRDVAVTLGIPGLNKSATIPQDTKISVPNRTSYILPLNLPVAKWAKIRYSTAEVLKASATERELRLVLHGGRDSMCEIVIEARRPHSVILDGKEIPFKHKDGLMRLSFQLTGEPQNLMIV
jgi:hypothetical protein